MSIIHYLRNFYNKNGYDIDESDINFLFLNHGIF